MGARTPSPYRVHFADTDNDTNSYNSNNSSNSKKSTTNTDASDIPTLVARTKQLTDTALTEREIFISKQQALLLVIEKQLDAAQLRLQLEVVGAGQAILRSPAASSSSTPTRSLGAYALVTAALSKSGASNTMCTECVNCTNRTARTELCDRNCVNALTLVSQLFLTIASYLSLFRPVFLFF